MLNRIHQAISPSTPCPAASSIISSSLKLLLCRRKSVSPICREPRNQSRAQPSQAATAHSPRPPALLPHRLTQSRRRPIKATVDFTVAAFLSVVPPCRARARPALFPPPQPTSPRPHHAAAVAAIHPQNRQHPCTTSQLIPSCSIPTPCPIQPSPVASLLCVLRCPRRRRRFLLTPLHFNFARNPACHRCHLHPYRRCDGTPLSLSL
ncbi:hypothetical protein M0R45_035481 [Rubus argutus]|uniref:Uncharacterized protein n=1 Tax=Rubus argutus TaxID=59490 RepID=A0AAW1VV10_RUBAR